MIFPPRGTGASSRPRSRAGCRRASPASPSTPAAPCSPTSGCARRWPRCSTSSGSTPICSAARTSGRKGSSTTANCRRSAGRPRTRERALLAPYPGAVRDDVMEGEWRAPVSDGSGRDRAIAKSALDELAAAGYSLRDGRLVDAHGAPLAFEILVRNREEERLALAYARNLARIGVAANVRLVDEVQFQRRRTSFDFDMMIGSWIASPSPGNEQRGPLELGGGQRRGRLQHLRRPLARGRCDDRGDPGRQHQRGLRRRGEGARPAAHLRLLHRAACITRLSSGSPIPPSSAVRTRRRCSASSFRAGGARSLEVSPPFLGPIGPVTLIRPDSFGLSWAVSFYGENSRFRALDLFGFPWILSCETRFINGLRWKNRKKISYRFPPA